MDHQKGLRIKFKPAVWYGFSYSWDKIAQILVWELCISQWELGLDASIVSTPVCCASWELGQRLIKPLTMDGFFFGFFVLKLVWLRRKHQKSITLRKTSVGLRLWSWRSNRSNNSWCNNSEVLWSVLGGTVMCEIEIHDKFQESGESSSLFLIDCLLHSIAKLKLITPVHVSSLIFKIDPVTQLVVYFFMFLIILFRSI